MSNITIFHTNKEVYFGSDTAISTNINNISYRLEDNAQKIFIINNMLIFCSGDLNISYKIMKKFQSCNNQSIKQLQLLAMDNYIKGNSFLEIMVGLIENNKTIVYQISSYDNFDIVKKELNNGEIGLWVGGFKTEEAYHIALELFNQKKNIFTIYQNVFDNISCEEIGGNLLIYKLDLNNNISLIYNYKINEPDNIKKLSKHMIIGEKIIGKILLGQRLAIDASTEEGEKFFEVNETGVEISGMALTITGGLPLNQIDAEGILIENEYYNGVKIDSTEGLIVTRNDNKIRSGMNATDGIFIEKYESSQWVKKLYADIDGNLIIRGFMEIGSGDSIFKADSNGIYLGSSDFNYALFKVNLSGYLTASNADIQGSIDCSSLKIAGTDVLTSLYQISGSAVQGSTIQNLNANNITTGKLSASMIDTIGLKAQYIQDDVYANTMLHLNNNELIFSRNTSNNFMGIYLGSSNMQIHYRDANYISIGLSGGQANVTPYGIWNFGGATVQNLSATAVFG